VTTDQAQATYAAEDLWEKEEPQARIKFGDWHEVQPFYARLAAMFRDAGDEVYPPTVYPRRGALNAHYDAATSAVYIPPYDQGGSWALMTSTAIHEFAHHLTPGAGHGPDFRAAMIECLEVMGWNAELLADCYAQAGLSTSDKVDGITDKVARLITHAEGKGRTLEEKKTFLEKAERLAAENSINLALIRKRQADADGEGKNGRDRPMTGKLFSLTALSNVTYRNLAVELGSAISRAHGAECAIRGKSQWLTFYGFPEDVHLTELMLTRVTPMMFEAADEYLRSPEHRVSGAATVSARITFCKNFSWEVGKRLREAVRQAERDVVETLELTDGNASVSTELVLREKAVEVRDYVFHEFKRQGVKGSWKGSSTNSWSGGAADAGRSAAKSANLYGRKELGS
jgi:putative metallohydrolase (TIGR04338 family)